MSYFYSPGRFMANLCRRLCTSRNFLFFAFIKICFARLPQQRIVTWNRRRWRRKGKYAKENIFIVKSINEKEKYFYDRFLFFVDEVHSFWLLNWMAFTRSDMKWATFNVVNRQSISRSAHCRFICYNVAAEGWSMGGGGGACMSCLRHLRRSWFREAAFP